MKRAFIFTSLILSLFGNTASAAIDDEYPQITIGDMISHVDKQLGNKKQRNDEIAIANDQSFQTQVTFDGKIRPMSQNHVIALTLLGKAKRADDNFYTTHFQHEINVTEHPSKKIYWIPIQETLLQSLMLEHVPNTTVTLYLVWLTKYANQHTIVINEFRTFESIISPLLNGDIESIKKRVQKNPTLITAKNMQGIAPIHMASQLGNLSIVKYLLEMKANINESTVGDMTPIHLASVNDHYDIATILLQHGANPNALTTENETAFVLAKNEKMKTLIKKYMTKEGLLIKPMTGK